MSRPKLLDLFCGAGGASKGYFRAGFDVEGVDIEPQKNYPFKFHQADALEFLRTYGHLYDVIVASPPCQAHTNAQKIRQREHPDLIAPIRRALLDLGKPYIIENVPGAPLIEPVELCGSMFGLSTYRHRLFESNVILTAPPHPTHVARNAKMGRPVKPGEFIQVVGNFSGMKQAQEAMGIDWMTRDEMREAIPPVFTECLGTQMFAYLMSQKLKAA